MTNMMNEQSPILSDGRIVSEGNVSTALRHLAKFPSDTALAKKDVTDTENALKRIWAEVYGEQKGTGDDKKAATDRDQRVVAARALAKDEIFNLEAARARDRAAEMIIEIFRTESSNARAAERIR